MHVSRSIRFVALILLLLSVEPLGAQQTLYGVTNSGQLCTINPMTGASTFLLPGPSLPMSAVGLGFYNGYAMTFDNLIGGFRLLDPNTGQNVGSPIFVTGLGPLGADGDFCFNASGMGFMVDGGFVPSLRSFNMATLTSTPVTILAGFPSFRGLAADATDPNKMYGIDGVGNFYWITNAPTGFANVTPVSLTNPLNSICWSAFNFGGLAMTSGNNLFLADNSVSNNAGGCFGAGLRNSLRQVNPATGALSGASTTLPGGSSPFAGIAFSNSTVGPPPPPPPPSGGGGGSSSGGTGNNGEGSYSFGFGRMPMLQGPVQMSSCGACTGTQSSNIQVSVWNIANRQARPYLTQSESGPQWSWAITAVSALILGLGALSTFRVAFN